MPTTQNFDGVTAPAIPAGWSASNYVTTSAFAISGANSATSGGGSPVPALMNDTSDTFSGNVVVEQKFRFTNANSGAWLAARWSTKVFETANGYILYAQNNSNGLQIQKMIAGANTILGSQVGDGTTFTTGVNYRMIFTLSGATLSGQVQRLSDNQWLQTNGTWGATQVTCITVTNSVYGSAGYWGIGQFGPNGIYQDDLSEDTSAASLTVTPTLVNTSSAPTLTVVGVGTSFVQGTTGFSLSGPGATGSSVGSITVADGTHLTVVVNTGTTTGTLTLTETGTGSASGSTTIAANPVTVLANDAALLAGYSPGGFRTVGTDMQTVKPGNGFKGQFTGTSLLVTVNVASMVAAGLSAGNYPILGISIDGAQYTFRQLASGDGAVSLVSGLSAGTHKVHVYFKSNAQATDLWTSPVEMVRFVSWSVDNGATIVADPGIRPKKIIYWGDSITREAYDDYSAYTDADSLQTAAQHIAQALNGEVSIHAYAGQGWSQQATGGVAPDFVTTWQSHDSGHLITMNGVFDYAIVQHGVNGSFSAATVAAWIASARAALGATTKIFVLVPFKGTGRTNITTGFNTAADSNSYLIDTASDAHYAVSSTPWTGDATHPRKWGHGQEGARAAVLMQAAIGGGSLSVAVVGAGAAAALTWGAVANAISYKVYRKTSPTGNMTYLATVTAPTVTYSDPSPPTGTSYYVVVPDF